jgi:methylmalonyl-CoA mutase
MSTRSSSDKLSFSEFLPASQEQWRAAADKLLKGAPFEKKMITRTLEGIELQPIYSSGTATSAVGEGIPGGPPFVRGTEADGYVSHPWLVAQETVYATPAEANAALRSDLQRGQSAVYLCLDKASRLGFDADKAPASTVGVGGISLSSPADLAAVLGGIDLATTPVYIEADCATPAILAMVVSVAANSGVPVDHLQGAVAADPLGLLVAHGSLPIALDAALDRMYRATAWASANAPSLRTIGVRSRVYHDAGADAVQELAFAIATGVDYVRAMVQRGMTIDDAAGEVWFSLCSGTNFFMEVAKFRAARMLWATAIEAFGGSIAARKLALHVRTSSFSATAVDPYVNMLRATTEAFAAGVGGCQSMHVGEFDEAVRPPDEFSRRIARNTQIILQAEAHLPKVIDPAGGSWYVESLTEEVAARSWKLFQEIEAADGMAAAVAKGEVQSRVKACAAKRAEGVSRRQVPIVGVTAYANPAEVLLESRNSNVQEARGDAVRSYRTHRDSSGSAAAVARIPARSSERPDALMAALIDAARHGATLGELTSAIPVAQKDEPATAPRLEATRLSATAESLRRAMTSHALTSGRPLRVFLSTIGPVAQHKARADFSAGFFAVAGCEVITPPGFATPEEAAKAACAADAEITVLCSTDETYPALVPAFCSAVKQASPDMTIVLAGYPQDHVEAFRGAGVDEFIHIRSNVLETLRTLLEKKGVRP